MNVYLDASVLMRVVLREPRRVDIWNRIAVGVSSELIRVECLRTVDRARIRLGLSDAKAARERADVLHAIDGLTLVPINGEVLARAEDPFPTTLGSLYAIHLATALLVRGQFEDLSIATHDAELATAARSVGFQVHGSR